jgi:SAM-dependent methyltransferase
LKKYRPSAQNLAVDIAPAAIKKAEQKYAHADIDFRVMDIQKEYKNIHEKFDLIVMSQLMWYMLPNFRAIVNHLGEEVVKNDGYLLVNQVFYKPEEQKYGKEIVSTIEDMLRLIKLEVIEMIEINRLSNHGAIVLFKKCKR